MSINKRVFKLHRSFRAKASEQASKNLLMPLFQYCLTTAPYKTSIYEVLLLTSWSLNVSLTKIYVNELLNSYVILIL